MTDGFWDIKSTEVLPSTKMARELRKMEALLEQLARTGVVEPQHWLHLHYMFLAAELERLANEAEALNERQAEMVRAANDGEAKH